MGEGRAEIMNARARREASDAGACSVSSFIVCHVDEKGLKVCLEKDLLNG